MNDLAEKALEGLQVARRTVRDHPLLSFGVLGTALGVAVVVLGGQVGAAEPTRPLTTWLGLQVSNHAPRGLLRPILLSVAVLALVTTWVALTEFVRRRPQRTDRLWRVAASWSLPFAIGPPLVDTSVYRSAAAGLLQRRGLDPHQHAPQRLGDAPVVNAIAPGLRGTPSSDGPVGTFLVHLATSVGGGSALATVIILRVTAVLAVVWCGRLAVGIAEHGGSAPGRGDRALSLVVLNPLVLLHLVSAAHLDALMIALVLAALLAARQRRWTTAVVVATLAASVEPAALVAVVVLIAAHLGARRRRWWVALGRDVTAAAALTAALGVAVPGGFGWLRAAGEQFAEHTPFSIPGATAVVLHPIVPGAAYDDLAIGGRAAAVVALACVLGYLVATVRARPVEQGVGFALLALALLAPSLQPWYLLWGIACLATTAAGGRRLAVVALSAAGCALVAPGFATEIGYAVTGGALLVVAGGVLAVLPRLEWGRPAGYRPPDTSRTAGRTSAR